MKKRKIWMTALLMLMVLLVCSVTVSAASKKKGLVKVNNKTYYYDSNGNKVKNKLGIKIKGKYYKISKKGVVTQVTEVEGLAGIQAEKLGRNLKKAFNWSASLKYKSSVGTPKSGQAAVDYYAIYGFKRKKGDCYVQAATFYWLAKVIGTKNIEYVQANIATGKDAKGNYILSAHAWVEQKSGKKIYFYDPNAKWTADNKGKTAVSYKFTYGTKNSYVYVDSHGHTK